MAKNFLNKIEQHRNNGLSGSKSILLVPGVWENFGFQEALGLAQKILSESKFLVFIAVSAHPLSFKENAHEINPHVFGNFSLSCMEARYFSDTLIGLGEYNFGGDLEFNFLRSAKKFFFCKMMKTPPKISESPEMLVRPSLFSFSSYPGPVQRKTGTEIVDDFLLVSLEKKQKRILDCLPTAGIFSKILADPDGVSPFFTSAQLYSPEITVDKDKVFELLSASRAREAEPLSKNCICSSATLVEPCDLSGLNRVIKLGRLDSLRSPEHKIYVVTSIPINGPDGHQR